jgi:hypothetical protein
MSQEDEWWEGLESTRDVFESRPTYLEVTDGKPTNPGGTCIR